MITADIRFDDIGAPIAIDGGGIFFGRSRIVPFAHRMLRSVVLESPHRIAIVVAERLADDTADALTHESLGERALRARLAAWRDHPLDVGILTLDVVPRRVRYRASAVSSAPIYLHGDGQGAAIDWDYHRLLAGRAVEVDWPAATAHVGGLGPYSPRTLVRDLYRSTADAELVATPLRVRWRLPTPTRLPGARELVPGASVEGALADAVAAILAARPIDRERLAVEISGGMDSGFVAAIAARLLGPGLMSLGAQFDGAMGEAQRERRALLRTRGGFDDLVLPAERYAPYGPRSRRRCRFGVWPQDENYPELFEAGFAALAAAGIDTLVSGFGGDELYFAYEGEEDQADGVEDAPIPPSFLSRTGERLARQAAKAYPRGPLQETCWGAAAGRIQRLLRHGIWPIYPYHSPALARFVASLPWTHRRDRALLRQALTGLLDDPVFEQDYVKETFRDVALRGMAGNQDYLRRTVRAFTARRPELFAADRIAAAVDGDLATLSSREFNALFFLANLCCFFEGDAAPQ